MTSKQANFIVRDPNSSIQQIFEAIEVLKASSYRPDHELGQMLERAKQLGCLCENADKTKYIEHRGTIS